MSFQDPKFPIFLVGGAVRDAQLGVQCKDLDYVVLAPDFDSMRDEVIRLGCDIKVESPQFVTIRAVHPDLGGVDFALARRDGEYSDQRRPDTVDVTLDLAEDLKRRDFTMGAMATCVTTGNLVDPFNGRQDIENRLIRAVGDPMLRLAEDTLRAFRALRFAVTKEFDLCPELIIAIKNLEIDDFAAVSTERIMNELEKMFRHDTIDSMKILAEFETLGRLAFENRGLWAIVTNRKR